MHKTNGTTSTSIFIYSSILVLLILSSCAAKKITYFKNTQHSLDTNIELSAYSDPKILPNDILMVSVQTIDPQSSNMMGVASTATFSTQPTTSFATGASVNVVGYSVDKNGMIELPLIGKIKLGGLTTTEAKEVIRKKAEVYYKDPVVNVRFANFSINVIGEVNRPSTYVVPSERINILDAIGMAGDLTIYGKRENVLLIREEDGVKKFIRFDLTSSDIFRSPYFYLRQGDVVYVEPSKEKIASTDTARIRTISLILSAASVVVLLLRFGIAN